MGVFFVILPYAIVSIAIISATAVFRNGLRNGVEKKAISIIQTKKVGVLVCISIIGLILMLFFRENSPVIFLGVFCLMTVVCVYVPDFAKRSVIKKELVDAMIDTAINQAENHETFLGLWQSDVAHEREALDRAEKKVYAAEMNLAEVDMEIRRVQTQILNLAPVVDGCYKTILGRRLRAFCRYILLLMKEREEAARSLVECQEDLGYVKCKLSNAVNAWQAMNDYETKK